MRLDEALLEMRKRYEERLNIAVTEEHHKYHLKKQKYIQRIAQLEQRKQLSSPSTQAYAASPRGPEISQDLAQRLRESENKVHSYSRQLQQL
jgi:hypothetical protein